MFRRINGCYFTATILVMLVTACSSSRQTHTDEVAIEQRAQTPVSKADNSSQEQVGTPPTSSSSSNDDTDSPLNNPQDKKLLETFLSKHPAPPVKPFTQSMVVRRIAYQMQSTRRARRIGNPNGEKSWAEAEAGWSYLIVRYKVKNLSKDTETMSYSPVLLAVDGSVYPSNYLASSAVWEAENIQDPGDLKPGQRTTFAYAFAVPESTATNKLRILFPDDLSLDNPFTAQISLR